MPFLPAMTFNKYLIGISVITIAVSIFTAVHFGIRQVETVFLKKELEQTSSHWTDVISNNPSAIDDMTSQIDSALAAPNFINTVSTIKGIVAYKVYDADGIIIASSQPGLIGSISRDSYLDERVRSGDRYIDIQKLEEIGHSVMAGIYQPIMQGDEFSGAFELYFDVTPLASNIREIGDYAILIAGIVLTGFSVGVFILFLHSRVERAHRETITDALRRAEAANESKSMFLANMSHEFRSPLNAIIGFSDMMLLSDAIASNSAKVKEYASDINQSGQHLLSLVDEVLGLAMAETAKMELQDDIEPMETLLARVAHLVSQKAEEKNVELQIPMTNGTLSLNVDSQKFARALGNVMSNAIKFTNSGGTIRLDIVRANEGGIEFSITDTGIGIPADKMTAVFEPFGQVSDSAYVHCEGMGLGIPISKRIIEAHGRMFSITSCVGIGTTVTITLPDDRVLESTNNGGRSVEGCTLNTTVNTPRDIPYVDQFDTNIQAGRL